LSIWKTKAPPGSLAATCLKPSALSADAACTAVTAEDPAVADAEFLKPPVVLFQAVAAVVSVPAVPNELAVAPVLIVKPIGKPVPIPLKFST
jgi:hypothetical protein